MKRATWTQLLAAAAALGPSPTPAPGPTPGTGGDPLPVAVEAVASTVTDQGTFTLRLACTPDEDLKRRYALRVALSSGSEDLAIADHELRPATNRWRAGRRVHCELPISLPLDLQIGERPGGKAGGQELRPGDYVAVRIGFVPSGGGPVRPLGGDWAGLADEDALVEVLEVSVPTFAGPEGRARLEEVLEEARTLRGFGDVARAWGHLEQALREAADDGTKQRLRDELAQIGREPPPAPTFVEEGIVAGRIRSEKVRVYRLEAGRMYDRGELHGALRLLEAVGGALALAVDEKVLGAIDDAQRATRRVEDLRQRLLTEISREDQATVDALLEEHGRTQELSQVADELAEKRRYPPALALYRKLRRVDGIELYDEAQERHAQVGEQYLGATPPEQAEKVRAVLEHPAWARTIVVPSHRFLFIGPKRLVEGIERRSKLRFDLAYVFVTDLFGRVPNPDGDRITVYFKELFDFGGGIGGGKIIDIGRADPDPAEPLRVDTGLLYHELTHCVDDTHPTHAGFSEGLANLGAAYAHEALDQPGDALHSFEANLASFRRYFLERDLEYWRIQSYGPSAGLFLHFVDTYASLRRGKHDWSPLRLFFREYREAPVKDGREPFVARALGRYLVSAFGPQAFDDLVSFGFRLEESDRGLLAREINAFEGGPRQDDFQGDYLDDFEGRFAECPNSPLPRDVQQRGFVRAQKREGRERLAELRAELGVVYDWKVIGPFFARSADPGAHPFVPESEIDFDSKPLTWRASRADRTQLVWQNPLPRWSGGGSHKNVALYPSGWLHFDYVPYGDDNAAIYALTHVTVPQAVDALAHLRVDDDFVLFVNDRRIGSYRSRGANGSSAVRWRGPIEHAADAMRLPLRFEAGRNKVLVKIRNRAGTAGVVLALSRPDGSRLEFEDDAGPPDAPGPHAFAGPEPTWKRVAKLDQRKFKSRTEVAVGSFRSRGKTFFGDDTDGAVAWRLFSVRPGFPKDSPSNLLWLKSSLTDDLDALRVDVGLAGVDAPKLLVTFQGEGEQDGLSGWNLILVPRGRGAVQARLERYDRLVYHSDPIELPEAPQDGRVLSLRYWDGWCTAEIDGQPLLERVSVHPIPGRQRIGLATWGRDPKLRSIEVWRGR